MDTTAKIWDVEKGVEINTLNVRDMYLVLLKNVPILKFKIVLKITWVYPNQPCQVLYFHGAVSGIILACAMCAMAHRFLKWRIEVFSMRRNFAQIFVTAHKQNLDAP